MEEKKKTISQSRKVQAYPSEKVNKLLEEFRVKNAMTRSEAVSFILRQQLDPPKSKHTY